MRHDILSNISDISTAASSIATCITVILISIQLQQERKQNRQEHEWNRRKTSEENLNSLVIHDFDKLLKKLAVDFDWDITDKVNDPKNYKQVRDDILKSGDKQKLVDLDLTLITIFRILEVISINMKHDIAYEDICKDYLFSLLVTLYKKCEDFVEQQRSKRDEPAVFINVEYYAREWNKSLLISSNNKFHKKKR
jgi:hypothetical protein